MVVVSTPTPWLGHHEILVECDEDEAEKVVAWLEKPMIDGMAKVLNGPDVEGPRVPVEVETQVPRAKLGSSQLTVAWFQIGLESPQRGGVAFAGPGGLTG
jgi:hypothetical protein